MGSKAMLQFRLRNEKLLKLTTVVLNITQYT